MSYWLLRSSTYVNESGASRKSIPVIEHEINPVWIWILGEINGHRSAKTFLLLTSYCSPRRRVGPTIEHLLRALERLDAEIGESDVEARLRFKASWHRRDSDSRFAFHATRIRQLTPLDRRDR